MMDIRRRRIALCAWAFALALGCGTALPAHAQYYGGYGYAYGFGWGYDAWGYPPLPVVVAHGPPLLTFDGQFYPVSVPGLEHLCELHPEICDTPDLKARLSRLKGTRIAGITMAWTGFAAALIGPIVTTAVNCANDNDYCRPSDAVLLSTVLGGIAVGVTGLAIIPTPHNVINYVNRINTVHQDHPVQIKLGLLKQPNLPGSNFAPALTLAMQL